MKIPLFPKNISKNRLLKKEWYYSIELEKGKFSNGNNFPNIVLTRKILKNIEVQGNSCLDIGTMEGLIPVLLNRRRADRVVSYDRRTDCNDKINLVKKILKVNFKHFSAMTVRELPKILKKNNHIPFDIVIFSGVLYHMFDPLGGLAIARGLTRNGGIMLLETGAIISDAMAMYFNGNGRFYPNSNFFLPSIECIDYLLRFLRLKPLDAIYFKQGKKLPDGLQKCRICIPARAVETPLPEENDNWMTRNFELDFEEFLNWRSLENNKPIVGYRTINTNNCFRKDAETIDIYNTIMKTSETQIKTENIILKLNDIY